MSVPAEERMVFIVGRGRSGTTLLKTILDAHPAISVAPEGLFVMNLHRSYRDGAWTRGRIQRFSDHLFLERRMRRWSVQPDLLKTRWLDITEPTFARMCAEVYELHADDSGKQPDRILGDKNPHYSLFIDELRATFPKARFIHVVRDYRDNVASFLNVPFDVKSPAALAHRWIHYNTAILESATKAPASFQRLRFEDLVQDPIPTLEALCTFLGVAMHPAILDSHESSDGYGLEWHRHIGQPIDPQLAGQWRHNLKPEQVATLDRICQPFASQFGYAPDDSTAATKKPDWIGAAMGWTVTTLERQVFRMPISIQARLINTYRRLTGNVIQ